jgi:hypothetical protein
VGAITGRKAEPARNRERGDLVGLPLKKPALTVRSTSSPVHAARRHDADKYCEPQAAVRVSAPHAPVGRCMNGLALDADKLEALARYEVHLDRKLERNIPCLSRRSGGRHLNRPIALLRTRNTSRFSASGPKFILYQSHSRHAGEFVDEMLGFAGAAVRNGKFYANYRFGR